MKFAVVGGGWAGMAAADALARAGHNVTVFELAQQLGGRARGIQDPVLGCIDNGQHLLIGAYTRTLALIDHAHQGIRERTHTRDHSNIGTNQRKESVQPVSRQPLSLCSADGSVHLKMPSWIPGSLGRLVALARARGLSVSERWQAVRLLSSLRLGYALPHERQTVSQWLAQHGQSEQLQSALWIPLCLATMNTPIESASAQLFARVIKDSLLSPDPGATDLIIPNCDLTRLWIDAVAARVEVIHGTHVEQINPCPSARGGSVEVAARLFDGCIIATPPSGTLRIVQNWLNESPGAPLAQSLLETLAAFDFLPITTCYMELTSPLSLPYPMLMLRSGHRRSHDFSAGPGQWVFNRNPLDANPEIPARLAFVISHAGKENVDRDALPESLLQQLLMELSERAMTSTHPSLTIRASRIITDKRATFAATPGLKRPGTHTDWPSIKLAGDWTDTGYPAVLEGAVMSGITAAHALMASSRA